MATDKRLDQVSQLTDFDYALIVKGDQVAKASKQQLAELVGDLLYGATNASSLASVVAGVMSANKIASFGFYNYNQTTVNANNLANMGVYRIVQLENYQELNYPVNNGYIVNQFVGGSGYQLFFYGDATVVYYRHKWNRWSDWIRIDNFGCNSLEELAAALKPLM